MKVCCADSPDLEAVAERSTAVSVGLDALVRSCNIVLEETVGLVAHVRLTAARRARFKAGELLRRWHMLVCRPERFVQQSTNRIIFR